MASRKLSKRYSIHKFITLAVIVIGVAGIGLTVFASQQQTQTESEAHCLKAPTLTHVGSKGGKNSVTYYLKLKNNCPGWNQFRLRVTQTPTRPTRFSGWDWRFNDGAWNTKFIRKGVKGSANINLTVSRPSDVAGRGGSLLRNATYRYIVAEANLRSNTNLKDTVRLKYVIEL